MPVRDHCDGERPIAPDNRDRRTPSVPVPVRVGHIAVVPLTNERLRNRGAFDHEPFGAFSVVPTATEAGGLIDPEGYGISTIRGLRSYFHNGSAVTVIRIEESYEILPLWHYRLYEMALLT
ncbi:MAG: hypothetical protein ACP5PJ_03070 [Acidimicrobiales bacterium]